MASSSNVEATKRRTAYGQVASRSVVDRFGVWLSGAAVRKHASFEQARFGDFGCGFDATFARTQLDVARSAVLVDLALADDLKRDSRVTAIEGALEEVLPSLPSASLEISLCLSVLEHLWEPVEALRELRRITVPDGLVLLNVPSWRGKPFLEFSAFKLHLSPAQEMDDHKRYYDPKDLWPLLVEAGFVPSGIGCHRHKFGLNTFAACRVPKVGE